MTSRIDFAPARAAVSLVEACAQQYADHELVAVARHMSASELAFAAVYLARNLEFVLRVNAEDGTGPEVAEVLSAWREQIDTEEAAQ